MKFGHLNNEIHGRLMEIDRLALKFVEAEARKILEKHSNLTEFVMGMGAVYFLDENGDIIYDEPKYIEESNLRKFIDKWDNDLKLSGHPMRFTAKGFVVTNW